ncbi:MAG: hypothetical protein U0610_07835 [bacterium]
MRRIVPVLAALLVFGVACDKLQNPFSRTPKVDARFLDYGPEPAGYQDVVRSSIEAQVTAPEVLKSVEIGEVKKASYFPPALNTGAGQPVEYLGWKVEAKYTVASPAGGISINRRVFFFNNNEVVVIEKATSNTIR